MSKLTGAVFNVTDERTGRQRRVEVGPPADAAPPGGGWTVGGRGSGADLELDEALDGLALRIIRAGMHTYLTGDVPAGRELPAIHRHNNGSWHPLDPREDGRLAFRFDILPLRIGRSVITLELRWTD